jgi:hypothetical protein
MLLCPIVAPLKRVVEISVSYIYTDAPDCEGAAFVSPQLSFSEHVEEASTVARVSTKKKSPVGGANARRPSAARKPVARKAVAAKTSARKPVARKAVAERAQTLSKQADQRARRVIPIIRAIKKTGVTTLQGIANALNKKRVATARGRKWHPSTVRNVLLRA